MKRLAVLFPGQGSQYTGMMKGDYDRYSIVRQTFEEASDTLGYDVAALCFQSDEATLAKSELTQPALLTAGAASYRLFVQETGIKPSAAIGHSLGEYTALTCAGVLKFSEALLLVRERGRLMMAASAAGLGRMLAIGGANEDEVAQMLIELQASELRPWVACYNSSQQIVLSGTTSAVDAAEELLAGKGIKLTSLQVSGAFHSPLMEPAAAELETLLTKCTFGKFDYPVISNVEAKPYGTQAQEIISLLRRQMTEPVRYRQSMSTLLKLSIDTVVELAPRKTLKRLFQQEYPTFPAYSIEDQEDRKVIFSSVFKESYGKIGWRYLLEQSLALAVSVKNRSSDEDAYQKQVVIPYRAIESLLLRLEQEGTEPTQAQLQDAWNHLNTILIAKGAKKEEYTDSLTEMERMLLR